MAFLQGGIVKKRRTVSVSIVVVTSTSFSAFCSLQEKDQAKSRLFSTCKDEHLNEHLPFEYDVSNTKDVNSLKKLCQDGYIILYSNRRRTPLFTAERTGR